MARAATSAGESLPVSPAQVAPSDRCDADMAVLETDEAAFPAIVAAVHPRMIVLNNLFRDQLDRYGELNSIATRWGCPRCPPIRVSPSSMTRMILFCVRSRSMPHRARCVCRSVSGRTATGCLRSPMRRIPSTAPNVARHCSITRSPWASGRLVLSHGRQRPPAAPFCRHRNRAERDGRRDVHL